MPGKEIEPAARREVPAREFLVYYSLSGVMVVRAAHADEASEIVFASLHGLVDKTGALTLTPGEASEFGLADAEVEIDSVEAMSVEKQKDTERVWTCDYMTACRGEAAVVFVEYDGIVDPDYTAETGNQFYGWWGRACEKCLDEIKGLVARHSGRMEITPLSDIVEENGP